MSRGTSLDKGVTTRLLATHGWIGFVLISIMWPLNWFLPGLRTHILFFPLWLGYVLTVDALVLRRRGSSILTRSRRDFVLLFVVSAPAWWLFEVINWRTQNWLYAGRENFSDLTYFLLASVAFSTVMPAVFETAEYVRSFSWIELFVKGPTVRPTKTTALVLTLCGLIMLGLVIVWPKYFYPFVWGSMYCLLEPVNILAGKQNLLNRLQYRDWRSAAALATGALICGFFWELWNYYAFPRWTYRTPGVEFLHVFEMPLLGYLGYLPFALELYALANLVFPRSPDLNL